MADTTGDRWAAGEAYEAYMGRWSRPLADAFVRWLSPPPAAHWLEVGCGTGALTSTVCRLCDPASIVACDPSEAFVEHAKAVFRDPRASFQVASAEALPMRGDGFDFAVSGLVLNFLSAPDVALAALRSRTRRGGCVAGYVWDYAGGLEFLERFWREAVEFDPSAESLAESLRFAVWTNDYLASCLAGVGLKQIETTALTIPTQFANFDDYWSPFLGGTGPAPSYVASLTPSQRDRLAGRLRSRVPTSVDGTIRLRARALAVRGVLRG